MRRTLLLLVCLFFYGLSYCQTITASGPTNFCIGGSVTLTITGTTAGSTFQWQKDGVDISGQTNASYLATTTGSYTVVVTVSAASTTYGPTAVTGSTAPIPSFTSSPNSQCGTVPVNFTNTTTGSGLTYAWNFGDPSSGANNTSTSVNPAHAFIGNPGNATQNFNVSLTADNLGCIRNFSSTVTIKQRPDPRLAGPGAGTFDGKPYFKVCTNAQTAPFTFSNTSTTSGTNTNYTIVWGDGSPNFTSPTFAVPTSHTYTVGTTTMLFIVEGGNGCIDTATYYVFLGTNPAVGLGNPGSTSICTGDSLTFPVSNTTSNSPGTIYTITFNDGTPAITFPHPAPLSFTHKFLLTSCGINSPPYSNSFSATIQARNPCQTSSATVVPIYVSQKSKASFSVAPSDTICVNNTLTVTNTSGNIAFIDNGSCTNGKVIWKVTPSTGWTIASGTVGNDFGLTDAANWLSGSPSVQFNFTTPGTYSIQLKTGNPTCGNDSVTRIICVNPAPVAAFNLSGNIGCAPFTVTTVNNSNTPLCKTNTYQWTVSYSNTSGCTPNTSAFTYLNGTSATSAAPEFQFINPGVYTIQLVMKNSNGLCTSAPVTQTITVKAKPQGTINSPAAVCQNGSINSTAIVNNCYSTTAATYSWSFAGGTPSTSTSSNPGPVVYTTSGAYVISLAVTNECGTTTITKNIIVNSAPDVTVPSDKIFCAGEQTGVLPFTGSIAGTVFNWTNSNTAIGLGASGTGSIPNFTATNGTTSPITATITVTPTLGCTGIPQTFTITVNPRPAKPTVVRPVVYCLNETATALSATASGTNTINWYTVYPLSGGTTTPPIPSTTVAGSTTYYVTQTDGTCQSDTAKIVVTVNPKIANNAIAADQSICNGSTANALTPQQTIVGGNGSYQYQWQQSTDGGATWTSISGAISGTYNPGVVTTDTKYRRVVVSSTCSDTSNIITILVQGSLTNVGIGINQTICHGGQPDTLRGQLPIGGNGTFSYQWESSPNNTNWTNIAGATGIDYYPPTVTATTYYRRKVTSGQCSVISTSVQITVNPKPLMTPVTDRVFCNNSPSGSITFVSTPSASSYGWINDNAAIGLTTSGTGNIPSFTTANNSNPKVPITAIINVAGTFTANSVSCVGDTAFFKIIVLPTINIAAIPDTNICTGQTIAPYTPVIIDTTSFAGVAIQYSWNVIGSGTTLVTGNGSQLPAYTTTNTGTTDLVTTVTITPKYSFDGKTCDGVSRTFTITVKPATANASAGADQVLCAATTATLTANFVSGTMGVWSQLAGSAIITTPNQNISTVTGLVPGVQYQFLWTQTGFASCPATKDTVVIDNKLPLTNKIDTVTKTVCAGVIVAVTGQTPTGGGNNYTYQWEQSFDGINFSPITGATTANINVTPTQTTWLRRFVTAMPCSGYSDTLKINVQPAITNNNINANQTICTGIIAQTIIGSSPGGGDNSFTYEWQQSINGGGTWTTIAGATAKDYSPGALTQTSQYRRIVSTNLCSGAFGSTSNVVTMIVNPDAKALFIPTDTLKCPPFVITPAVINLQPSAANSQYQWYANNVLIGSGTTFPGYSIFNENDSVIIKLVAISAFGCKNDSLSQQFKTVKKPTPSFTVSDTVGCGPLTVTFINTSTYVSEYSYFWDFGNGLTSTAVQPGSITFAPNPAFGDTTYVVRLKVFSPCDTLTFTRSIRVKSKPKALFTPVKTSGCSPMIAVFRNNSKGLNNTYHWNFGDGTTLSTTSTDSVHHTYITGVVDTFYVKLKAVNECGADSITYSIIVTPNTIKLNVAVNGTDLFGCQPHPVAFVNNTQGASVFSWNFGDGASTTTTKNIDTVRHTYLTPGTYNVTIRAINNCSDTTTTMSITVYAKPKARFTADKFSVCRGDSVRFINLSDSATAYQWLFGDGGTSTLNNPFHIYPMPGTYIVRLVAYRDNASGNSCTDTTTQTITVTSTQTGLITVSDSVGNCAPFTVTFVNKNRPSVTTLWDLGDGTTANGDSIVHTYQIAGTYLVKLTATVPGGCTYITNKTIIVNGPKGTLQYNGGFVCSPSAVQFQAIATGATAYVFDFGDGQTFSTTQQIVFHTYANPGFYLPKVTLQNGTCNVALQGVDTIKVDKVDGGFTFAKTEICGNTTLTFTDTSHVFSGVQNIKWNFGDNTTGTGSSPSHSYAATGRYIIQMIVISNSGCTDTVSRQIDVLVKSKPVVSINAIDTACTRRSIAFNALVQTVDAINFIQWNISNGASGTGATFNYTFTQPGVYDVRLVVGTVNGCYDTAKHTIVINPSPVVTATPSLDLCRGNTVQLNAIGAATWQWLPLSGLSCYTCPSPIASPIITTPYVIEGKNSFGCADYDTVVITVIQPLQMNVSPGDSICIGESINLLASGATSYNWSPAIGLNNTTISNPTASPTVTTTYRVVGYDGYNCFTDTAFVTIGVGQYPTISLGPDLTLATGTMHPLTSNVTNGPITKWSWTPFTNLSCNTCAVPVAEIKKNISYSVIATTAFGCSASDTININVSCSQDQVYIPNAFSPDGDGINDILMVRAKGVVSVKYFRIFNRWGELVFEKSNFVPNNPLNGWNGKVKGVAGGPDVFVYTCEAICENGSVFTYKGNVTIIK